MNSARICVMLVAFALTAGSGCGTTPELDASRLLVNDTLRLQCNFLTDNQIAALIQASETDRLNGLTSTQTLNDSLQVCANTTVQAQCNDCMLAIVRQVYHY
jgi:hypothetical protein